MLKKVRYNGGTKSYYGCTDPSSLTKGMVYEVISQNIRDWQTDYVLKGLDGSFNSVWFDDVTSEEKIYMALGKNIPIVGESYYCSKIEFTNVQPQLVSWCTSVVKSFTYLGNNIYKIITQNSIYIVAIG